MEIMVCVGLCVVAVLDMHVLGFKLLNCFPLQSKGGDIENRHRIQNRHYEWLLDFEG
jgi:hypothetical protein